MTEVIQPSPSLKNVPNGVRVPFNEGSFDGPVPFKETLTGWHGYIPWHEHTDWRNFAKDILDAAQRAGVETPFKGPLFEEQAKAVEPSGGIVGARFTEYYMRLGSTMSDWPKEGWSLVKKEKDANMQHVLTFPYNGEARKDDILVDVVTPNSLFFVRNHGNVPIIDAEAWSLNLEGLVREPKVITYNDLRTKFPRRTALVTLVCSGTRRKEQQNEALGEFDELINAPWTEQAIGTARWTGVSLKTLIDHCGGLRDEATDIEMYGADTYFKRNTPDNYIVSIPIRKTEDTIIAFEMNGKTLPLIHGFPVRAVVPGYIGARSVKWLYRLKAIDHPSLAPVQSQEYLYFTHQTGKHNMKYSSGFSIQGMPISSAIMSPKNGEVIYHEGQVHVTGWAYTGGAENWVERVEVSPNGGFDWYAVPPEDISPKYWHAWRIWKIDVPCPAEGYLDLTVRAWDANMNTQPTNVRDGWNWDTHVTNSCHHIQIYSVNRSIPATAERLARLDLKGIPFEPLSKPLEFEVESEEQYLKVVKQTGTWRDPVE